MILARSFGLLKSTRFAGVSAAALFNGMIGGRASRACFSSDMKKRIEEEFAALKTPYSNVTEKILELAGQELYKQPNHPLGIMRYKFEEFFTS